MMNEALCKILCHNICVCISAWYELGIDPVFGGGMPNGEAADLLPFARPG